jgi:amino acid adenylation domain-containing protein
MHPPSATAASPLSFAQERMWFLWRLDPANSSNHLAIALRCRGKLDVEGLQWALNEVVRRHDVLHTVFNERDGVREQCAQQGFELRMPLEMVQENQLPDFFRERSNIPFDLERVPAIRATLVRLKDEEHVLLLVLHHIVADAWSLGILLKETAGFYRDFLRGESSPLRPLLCRYAQFAAQQRAGEAVFAEQLAYWRRQLGSGELPAELAGDMPRPELPTYRGKKLPIRMPAQFLDRLRELSKREGVTLFMLLLAPFQTMLARWTGQQQAITGTPVANRSCSELEELIGFFVNTLVLRIDFSGNPSVRELLGRVRDVCLNAYARQDIPLERLVEALNPGRDLGRNPLFQIMFALQNAPLPAVEVEGLRMESIPVETGTSQMDISLSVWEAEDGIAGWLEYSTDLFREATIKRMAGHFQIILEEMSADPDRRISELQMLSSSERREVLIDWNRTDDAEIGRTPVHRLFQQQVERTPGVVAVAFGKHKLTYDELNKKANRLARHLRNKNIRPDKPMGICMERSIEMIVAVLAIMKVGAACVALDPEYPRERLQFILQDTRMPVVLSCDELSAKLGIRAEIVDVKECARRTGAEEENLNITVEPANAAYVIYTSGSTGRPKGVVMTHGPISNLIQWQITHFCRAAQKTLQFASLNFDVSFQEIFSTLCSGGTLILISEQDRLDFSNPVKGQNGNEIERLFIPFIALEHLGRVYESHSAAAGLKEVITAGEQLQITPALREMFGENSNAALVNQYGPSETHVVTSYTLSGRSESWPALPPIGKPIANVKVYVLDSEMMPVPVRVPGELYLGGAGVGRGYINCPELTAERFLPDPYSQRVGQRLYRTGDRVQWTEAGDLEFLGRFDDQVKIRGYRIELGEIEAALRAYANVRDAAVVVRKDHVEHKRLVAYIVWQEQDQAFDAAALRELLKDRLPEYMIPATFMVLEELPLTPSGKVNRRALPEPDWENGEGRRVYVAPKTAVEQTLCDICAQLLGLEKVGLNDNFFELGGDSLLCLQFVARARSSGLLVEVRQIFLYQTFGLLSNHVQSCGGFRIQRRYDGGWAPLSYAQESLWMLYRLESENPFYNLGAAILLKGPLDARALENSLNDVVRRHSIFRTAFDELGGRPVQRVMPWSKSSLPAVFLPANNGANFVHIAAIEAARREIVRPFRLQEGRPMRAVLFAIGPDEHVLALGIHHITCDGWSINLLVREIRKAYEAFQRGQNPDLPTAAIEYADFVLWQRETIADPSFAERLAVCTRKLDGCTGLKLPTDYPRPDSPSYRGAIMPFLLDQPLCAKLRLLGRNAGATLNMVLLAAFAVLLQRYSGESDIAVGVPVSGRNHHELEDVAGLFVNTVVVRIDASGDPSYSELLERVKEAMIEALAYEDVPLEKIVEALRPAREPSRDPLFQVLFSMQTGAADPISFAGIRAEFLPLDPGVAKFDLSVELLEAGETVHGAIEYSSDLFHPSSIAHIIDHYRTLLEMAIATPNARISELSFESEGTKAVVNALQTSATFDMAAWPAEN